MIALYEPKKGVKLGIFNLIWKTKREIVRNLLNEEFETADPEKMIESSLHIKQDIYSSILGNKCMIFLNYNNMDELIGIEIHYGISLQIKDEIFSFKENLHHQLKNSKLEFEYLNENEISFIDFNLSIINDLFMCGEGDRISSIEISPN